MVIRMANQGDPIITINDLPISFNVKYLGHQSARGLWGIKHTRKPVDSLVATARSLPTGQVLPLVKVEVSKEGLKYNLLTKKHKNNFLSETFRVETISYGVQDVVYTKVFCMIVVKEEEIKNGSAPFECHAFVCDSRNQARQLTYALAAAFQEYGKTVKEESKVDSRISKKSFSIDLRTPEELEQSMNDETEA